MYRYAVLLALLATLGTTMVMKNTKIGVKAAMDRCSGTLGSVHWEGGHMMVLGTPGVDTQISSGGADGKQKIVFQNQLTKRTAVVTVDGKRGTVWVKNVLKNPNSRLMCILPD
ncbi:MAG: hypothetical protein NVS9B12_05220 [Vulcanimicrobiaceae bacterium]